MGNYNYTYVGDNISCWCVIFMLSSVGLSQFAGLSLEASIIIAFALSFSSTVLVVKVLEDRGELSSFHGKIAIGILVIQDIFAVIFLALSNKKMPSIWALALPLYLWLIKKILYKLLYDSEHGELLSIFGFFATFVAGALSFSIVGLKPDLGALIMGMLLVNHPKSKELYKKMLEYKDFFLVAFFMSIGLSGDITINAIIIAIFLLVFPPLKGLFYVFIITRFNIRGRTSFLSAVSLTNYSEFGLIVGMTALKFGLIQQEWLVAIALAVAVSFILSSPINQYVHQIYDYINPLITRLNIKAPYKKIDENPISLDNAKYLVIGLGTVGLPALDFLSNVSNNKVIGMDYSHDTIKDLKRKNRNVVWGDSTDITFWENTDFSNIDMVLLAMSDFQSNLNTFNEIKKLKHKTYKVGVIVNYPDQELLMKELGIDFVYNYKKLVGADFAEKMYEEFYPMDSK
ncbi:MAG: cation:proton antiporter [Sphingobacteriales bacterium]|nr:MAG: cation:proton antiporter [Sphingobacteriales bacterium]